jgi:hypothetical protein
MNLVKDIFHDKTNKGENIKMVEGKSFKIFLDEIIKQTNHSIEEERQLIEIVESIMRDGFFTTSKNKILLDGIDNIPEDENFKKKVMELAIKAGGENASVILDSCKKLSDTDWIHVLAQYVRK